MRVHGEYIIFSLIIPLHNKILVQRLKIGHAPLTLFDSYRISIEIYMVYFQDD